MCGILGIYSRQKDKNYNFELQDSLDMLSRRGPDDQGISQFNVADGVLTLCQKRLAIIDLSKGGHQPFESEDGRFILIFNGEIYNYLEIKKKLEYLGVSFRYKSDTEVLLQSWIVWGIKSLKIINGMFSFVIFDKKENLLTCVRDPYGIKPFYFYFSDNELLFSSELPPLKRLLKERVLINKTAIYNYIIAGYNDINEQTFFKNLYNLIPGNFLSVKLDKKNLKLKQKNWYQSKKLTKDDIKFEDASQNLRELFFDSIKLHLRSDVPLGVSLSGGIDSSSIVCAIKKLDPKFDLNTFSYIANTNKSSEERWVDIVNDFSEANPFKTYINDSQFPDLLDEFIYSQGEPHQGLSFFAEFCIYKKAKEHGFKVILDGHGADEVLGGYSGYPVNVLRELLEKRNIKQALEFSLNWSRWPSRSKKSSVLNLLKAFVQSNGYGKYLKTIGILSKGCSPNILKLFGDIEHFNYLYQLDEENYSKGSSLWHQLNLDLVKMSCPPQLRGADRSAMWHSIENRVPFLSPKLVEFVTSLPTDYLVSKDAQTKFIFRNAMRDILPEEIFNRKDKIGYEVPLNYRIKFTQELKKELSDLLDYLGFLDSSTAINLMTSKNNEYVLLDGISWRIFNLLKWVKFNFTN